MDEQRFDQLSRSFASFRTRRQALRAIAGAVVATVAGSRAASATVSCTPHYSPCTGDDHCCSGSVCEYGLCMPGCRIDGAFQNAWASPPDNACQQCLPDVSTTAWTPANEGLTCWSGDPNAGSTFCQEGVCATTGPAECPPPPPCHTDQLVDPATCTYAVAEAGTPCGLDAMCHGGFYQPADTCDSNGFCIGGGSQVAGCDPYTCNEDGCLTSCASRNDCLRGLDCAGGRCGTCDAVMLGLPECSSDSDCGGGRLCHNGGCFSPCSSGCTDECTNCQCVGSSSNGQACRDANFGIGACISNADCPVGSVCSNFNSGNPNVPRLCTRPCPEFISG